MSRLDQQDVAVPAVARRADRQSAKYANADPANGRHVGSCRRTAATDWEMQPGAQDRIVIDGGDRSQDSLKHQMPLEIAVRTPEELG